MAVDGTSQVEGQYIRGLDIDKTLKGFGKFDYVFRSDCLESTTSGDAIRWYSRTATDLTAVTPGRIANVASLALPETLEGSITRNTSYTRKYFAECFISLEDINTADIDMLAQQLSWLTRAIAKEIDTRIWDIMTQSRVHPTNASTDINLVTASGAWVDAAADPIRDIMAAKLTIWVSGGYNPEGASLYLSPLANQHLCSWLIVKGALIPSYSSGLIGSNTITRFLGLDVKVSENVTADYAAIMQKGAVTWKSQTGLTSNVTDNPGMGKRVRVWEVGEAILTDPKKVCLISNVD